MMHVKLSKKTLAVLTVIGLLVYAGVVYASGGVGAEHGEAHGGGVPAAKWWDLLWRTLNFAGLVIILVLALKKPIVNGLASRRQAIRDQFEELEARKSEAERVYKEYEAKLAKIDEEANKIIATAVEQGELEKERIIAEAERSAGDMKRQAEMAVQHELAEAKQKLRSEMAEQAVLLAEELISKNIQPADQSRMVENYLDKVGAIQ